MSMECESSLRSVGKVAPRACRFIHRGRKGRWGVLVLRTAACRGAISAQTFVMNAGLGSVGHDRDMRGSQNLRHWNYIGEANG